jgi:hypothetical protein
MLNGRRAELNLNGGRMTEYDAHKIFAEQQERDRVTALHADKGVIELRYADGTTEIYKKRKWLTGFKLIRRRQ